MVKFFFYIVFLGLFLLIFSRLFDVKTGKWYILISVKKEIIKTIQGKEYDEIEYRFKDKLIEPRKKQSGSGDLKETQKIGVQSEKVLQREKPLLQNQDDGDEIKSIIENKLSEDERKRKSLLDDSMIESVIEKSLQKR